MACVLSQRRTFAVAELSSGQNRHVFVIAADQHGNDLLAFIESHTANAGCGTAHGANFIFGEADNFAVVAKEHDIMLAVGHGSTDQNVAFKQIDGVDTGSSLVLEVADRCLLDRTVSSGHEDIEIFGVILIGDRQNGSDFFVIREFKHIDDRTPLGRGRTLGHIPNVEPVQTALVGEAQQHVVRCSHKQLINNVAFLHLGGAFALTAAFLSAVFDRSLALDVAGIRQGYDHFSQRDQVFCLDVFCIGNNLSLSFVAEFGCNGFKAVGNDRGDAFGLRQNVGQINNSVHEFFIFCVNLFLFQAGQALQAHLKNVLSLHGT